MPEYRIGNIGSDAVVVVGEGNVVQNVEIVLHTADEAEALIERLRSARAQERSELYTLAPLRRLRPIVMINRARELAAIAKFLASPDSLLFIYGLAGIGKSQLARASLEFRANVPVVWIPCSGLELRKLVLMIDAGLTLELGESFRQLKRAEDQIRALIAAIPAPAILVFDGLEALLDERDGYANAEVETLFRCFEELEHPAKVLATTDRLPRGVSDTREAVATLQLAGLDGDATEALLRELSGGDPGELSSEVHETLGGHPQAIEILASAVVELGFEEGCRDLIEASDIQDFASRKIVGALSPDELRVLLAAQPFRGGFEIDALRSVFATLFVDCKLSLGLVRGLARRSLLERCDGPEDKPAYLLHPIVSEALHPSAEQIAAGHLAASAWYLREGVDVERLESWDDGLFQLRCAARAHPPTGLPSYRAFLTDYGRALSYAGWSRRLASELVHAIELNPDPSDTIVEYWTYGLELWQLDEYESAAVVFEELLALYEHFEGFDDLALMTAQKLGSCLIALGELERAEQLAEQQAALGEVSQDSHTRLRYAELRFAIARAKDDLDGRLEWANRCLVEALAWLEGCDEPDDIPRRIDAVAEANFALGAAHLVRGDRETAVHHFFEQLRLKLAIGKRMGIATALSNVLLTASLPLEFMVGLILIMDYIHTTLGETPRDESLREMAQKVRELLAQQPDMIGSCREQLAEFDDELLPYFEDALVWLAAARET